MKHTAILKREGATAVPQPLGPAVVTPINDDAAMLRAAANVTRDLNVPEAWIYWADLGASALVGYAALLAAMAAPSAGLAVIAGLVAVLALYRAGSFIHELTHIKSGALRGFRLAWNALIG